MFSDPNCRPGFVNYLKGTADAGTVITVHPGDTNLLATVRLISCKSGYLKNISFANEVMSEVTQNPQIPDDPTGVQLPDGGLITRNIRFALAEEPIPANGSQDLLRRITGDYLVTAHASITDGGLPFGPINLDPGSSVLIHTYFDLTENPNLTVPQTMTIDWTQVSFAHDGGGFGSNISAGVPIIFKIEPRDGGS